MPPSAKKKFKSHKRNDPSRLNRISKKPFKSSQTNKSNGAVLPAAVALQLENDVPDFPRGGIGSQSTLEKDGVMDEVENGKSDSRTIRKKKSSSMAVRKNRNSAIAGGDDLGSLFGDGISGKIPRFANRITLKNISPGMKLWGVVAEVNDKDIMVSLPGGLKGIVRLTDAFDPPFSKELEGSDVLSRLFHVGQLVSCIVSQLDDDNKDTNKRKIWLSLRLSSIHNGITFDSVHEAMVLCAYVKSIEDHGYILHFGLPSFTGFLARDSRSDVNGFKVGQLVQGVVEKIDRSRKMVYLCSDQDAVCKSVIKDAKGMSIDVLSPGMMVNARVHSVLENGIMLSFQTYFTGTVDIFHLQDAFPKSNWKESYVINKKVNARILFIDPTSRAIGLTLNPYLVRNKAPPMSVRVGGVYDNSKVVRMDKGSGLLLELLEPISTPVYVSVSDFSDGSIKNIQKAFKEGKQLCVRILGFRNMEGLATGTLKTSALEGPLLTHSDVKAGMVVRAKVITVNTFGAIVLFSGGLKALCPLRHMSEFEITKPRKKFKVGAELVFRVLGCKSKRITVTHKKSLVKSKHPILCSYADATVGLITHGWITKIEPHGCFVHFYNGVQGFTPRSELGLEPGLDITTVYRVGQVVKCRVLNSLPSSHRINLSFTMRTSRRSQEEIIKLGSIVAAVVENLTDSLVSVCVKSNACLRGTITVQHLADYYGQAMQMMSFLKPGYEFEKLIVLDIETNNVVFSAKPSLIRHANELPTDINHVLPQKMYHGYICNVIDSGCFVRFLGRLTGFSPKRKAINGKMMQLAESYFIGQSVRCFIDEVNNDSGRVNVSLQQSLCASSDASFITDLFTLEEKIGVLQSLHSSDHERKWVDDFNLLTVVEGTVHELKDVGAVISFKKYADVFGFITQYQLNGSSLNVGSIIHAAVIDIAQSDRLVDLSLKPEFIENSRVGNAGVKTSKKRKSESSRDLKLRQSVCALVEIVKEAYVVLSIPQYHNAIGFASLIDYNMQKVDHKKIVNGQSVMVSVASLPASSTSGRLIMSLDSLVNDIGLHGSKKSRKDSNYNVGSLVEAEIIEIKALELKVKFGYRCRGRVHITEVNDGDLSENPLLNFKIGQSLTAKIVGVISHASNSKHQLWELSIKPSVLSGSVNIVDSLQCLSYPYGSPVRGYVYKVDGEWAWLAISRDVNAQLFILDTSCEPSELCTFEKRFAVGQTVKCRVLTANIEKRLLRVALQHSSTLCGESGDNKAVTVIDKGNDAQDSRLLRHIHQGDIIGGRIMKVLAGVGGVLVQIDPHVHGKVHFTELHESWVPDPLSGLSEGQFVKCKVVDITRTINNTIHVDLSLRLSSDIATMASHESFASNKRVITVEDVHPSMIVQGYVKNVSPKGCFICLSRNLDAKIQLSNLSDRYIDNPANEFPIGMLVKGRVISVEPLSKRIEVTLKDSNSSQSSRSSVHDLSSLTAGDKVSGVVRRVERYGVFIAIENTNLVGLCHISEIPLEDAGKLETKYATGAKVMAKILKVDVDRHRISLGLKNLEQDDIDESLHGDDDSRDGSADPQDDFDQTFPSNIDTSGMDNEPTTEEIPVFAYNESMASVPPLEIPLDDIEETPVSEPIDKDNELGESKSKANNRSRKREKEEREIEIRAAEERLLEKDIPRSADEFERVIRSSPNSSFLWIKYMAFMLSLADVEKARAIAERALRTINVREEDEKLNVWVSYFNLENEFGSPREEAVKKVFDRALQYCDPKKVHHALLGVYERTAQTKLADELLEKMAKKFKDSCKIWVKKFQNLLSNDQEGAQALVRRALLCLPRRKHIKFITQAAILEFKCGVPDRGRSMFETILKEYPKRMDLWSIYLDQEIKAGDADVIRALFERAITLSVAPRKIKFLFKRYMEYEKSRGEQERIEYVKRKAMEYVQNTLL